jgi:2-amino-4-hydroxy-6-hydroxymethyldihydropteridine diphosphokinase
MSHTAFVALGANLAEPARQLRAAASALDRLPHSRLRALSSLYRTAPIGVGEQPDYINAVARLETDLPAAELLTALLALEAEFGRCRAVALSPRTLDLDLLLYDDARIDLPELIVPHPRMHLRAFVLVPLLEIAPTVAIPGLGAAADWLPGVADQAIERLPEEDA